MQSSLEWCHRIHDGGARDWIAHPLDIPFRDDLSRLAYHELAKELFREGYVVFPLYSKKQSNDLMEEFKRTEEGFREYNRTVPMGTKENPYVLGGFGAYGNPSSFHNDLVRKIRRDKMRHIPIFGELLRLAQHNGVIDDAQKYRVALFMDRMCRRITGTSTTKESYHSDLIPKGRETDLTIGGWIQLSPDTTYFSCVPRTHSFFPKASKKGFALQKHKECTHEVPVPQGSILMFFQSLGHCVYSTKRKTDSFRVFSVYLLTTHPTHIYDYKKVMEENGVPRLASHQLPPMYGPNHASFWLDKMTVPWSERVFKKKLLVEKQKKDGTKYTVVESPMKSLKDYGLRLYRPYQEWERRLFIPSQEFNVEGQKIKLFL